MHHVKLAAAAVAAIVFGGCGSGSAPSCETVMRHVAGLAPSSGAMSESAIRSLIDTCVKDHWSDSMRSCAGRAKAMEDLAGCHNGPVGRRRDRSEAELNLIALGKSAGAQYAILDAFPTGTLPLTPATPCCAGADHKCPADPADWRAPLWEDLTFELVEPSHFQYDYTSDGKIFTARAVGDLDCDGTSVTYVLRGSVDASGNSHVALTKPDQPD